MSKTTRKYVKCRWFSISDSGTMKGQKNQHRLEEYFNTKIGLTYSKMIYSEVAEEKCFEVLTSIKYKH